MQPVKVNLEVWQGKTFEEPYTFGTAIKNEDGELVDIQVTKLNGYTGRMQLRSSIDSADVVLELTTENDRIIIDADHGIVTLYIADEDTALLPVGSYKYDLELITASGRVYGPLYGTVKVKGEVTRDA